MPRREARAHSTPTFSGLTMLEHTYDFFIAHATNDSQIAEELYDLLIDKARVFLAGRSLMLGDDWDIAIPAAQLRSRVTVVLISQSSPAAFYERDEVREAISLARSPTARHRVVPVFTDTLQLSEEGSHYGIRLKHGITLSSRVSLSDAAAKLLALLDQIVGTSNP